MTSPPVTVNLGEVESTMAVCREMVGRGQLHSGQAVLASHQSHGRGRIERVWIDVPESSVLMTTFNIVKIEQQYIGLLSILAGVVVAEYLRSLEIPARIKWPNDILIDDRKVGGILIVTTPHEDNLAVFAGFGINVLDTPQALGGSATCLGDWSDELPPIYDLSIAVHQRWNRELSQLDDKWAADLVRRWEDRSAWIGETVTLNAAVETTGRIHGITLNGHLILEAGEGLREFAAGDVVRGPRRTL